ncbi:MAG TPA: twin-arginine translocase TatA/TatE family subunit [Gemmatimonadales bacterium]|nr:twin-arginine translocase TatA/TatE family subunit [Gemmatimonadales bacterium]
MFGDLSLSHILILMLVLVLVFGAKRIPEIGSSLGQGIREFKRSLKEIGEDRAERRPLESPPPTSPSSMPTGSGEPKRLNQ